MITSIVLNAKFGDGCIHKRGKHPELRFNSTSNGLIQTKHRLCMEEGITPSSISIAKQLGYGTKPVYQFATKQSESISRFADMPNTIAIEYLEKPDIALWYLDDGTYHKTKYFGHLHCNSFTEEETKTLQYRIDALYGLLPAFRLDKKKDGRSYPYLYLGVKLMKEIKKDVQTIIEEYGIYDMNYKIGL